MSRNGRTVELRKERLVNQDQHKSDNQTDPTYKDTGEREMRNEGEIQNGNKERTSTHQMQRKKHNLAMEEIYVNRDQYTLSEQSHSDLQGYGQPRVAIRYKRNS
jgi:hypothetical protein